MAADKSAATPSEVRPSTDEARVAVWLPEETVERLAAMSKRGESLKGHAYINTHLTPVILHACERAGGMTEWQRMDAHFNLRQSLEAGRGYSGQFSDDLYELLSFAAKSSLNASPLEEKILALAQQYERTSESFDTRIHQLRAETHMVATREAGADGNSTGTPDAPRSGADK